MSEEKPLRIHRVELDNGFEASVSTTKLKQQGTCYEQNQHDVYGRDEFLTLYMAI
jgi:hypothetical protein